MKRNKRILFLNPYPFNKAPSQRLKFEQYYPAFESNGYKLRHSAFISEDFWKIVYQPGYIQSKILHTLWAYIKRFFVLFTLPFYDIVYVHLWVSPFGPPLFERITRLLSKKLVYDIDDMIYLQGTHQQKSLLQWMKGRTKPIYLMKHADEVIVCTPALLQFAQQFQQNCTDISSTIDTDIYQPKEKTEKSTLTLGWSGSKSTSVYALLLEPVLLQLKKKYQFEILIIGNKDFTFNLLEAEAVAWSAEEEVKQLQRIDIGLYPLPDEPWVYGKSGLKALQYMALEIPTVATAIGTNFRVIDHGNDGFLAANDEEWYSTLDLLISSLELRKKIGKEARKKVIELYSIHANVHTYLKVLERALKA
jgi:glycosyltransferase involved in cell wall biosynthesis